jgi:predicted DNA-binding transcriptional regulator YafY
LRDIDALSYAGVPLHTEGGHGGGVALDEHYRTTLTGLQESEARALFIAGNSKLLDDVGLGEAADRTLLKLLAALPRSYQPSVEHIRQRILIDPLWWWHDSQPLPFWEALQQAVYEDRRIQAVYEHHDGSVAERLLEPYSLVAKSSLWYLVASREGELRTYRVSRFHDVVLLDDHFHRRDDFDLPSYWRDHLQEFTEAMVEYHFTLRIHPDRLNFVRWLAPGRCHVEEPPDVDGWFVTHVQMESLDLAKMLVFGLGMQAEVIEPRELEEAVLSAAREIQSKRVNTEKQRQRKNLTQRRQE